MEQQQNRPLAFVVDDQRAGRLLLRRWLEAEGLQVVEFETGEACLQGLSEQIPQVILLDLTMPGMGGLETLRRINATHPHLPIIILTAATDVDTVVTTIRRGAYDYLTKPVEPERLLTAVRNALERHALSLRLTQLEREAAGGGFPGILGNSPAMRELFRQIDRLSAADVTVLIRGESGTGKELVARALHAGSGRSEGPFVAVNCAAIPENLQESELFGHAKGAFTGALNARQGKFEAANGGTLFLDELGELSPAAQAKLLRVLQQRVLERVGSNEQIPLDFRLVSASNRDLAAEVRAGRFREDLYFRVAVYELQTPPLRERGSDIGLLTREFLDRFGREFGREGMTLAPETVDALMSYSWPGNVRELENVVQRLIISSPGQVARIADLPATVRQDLATDSSKPEGGGSVPGEPRIPEVPLEELERLAIEQAIERSDGNLTNVSRLLGIGRTTLYRKLRQYGLRREDVGAPAQPA